MRRVLFLALYPLLACAAPAQRAMVTADPQAQAAARAADHAELLRLHERQRVAHLQKRADWLLEPNVDSMFSLSNGRVSLSRRAQAQPGFQQYLDASTFQAWDDIVPPRIRISADGQMAFVVVEKKVHLTALAASGATEARRTRYAWLSVYEKQAGQWRMVAIASTDRPDPL